jgi:hypothetical protein
MKVCISLVDGHQSALLESLGDWLRGEPQLAGRVSATGPEPASGELGVLSDALVVAVGSGGTLSALAMSLKGWLSQPRRSDVRIQVRRDDGAVVEIAADRVHGHQIEALLREVLGSPPEV